MNLNDKRGYNMAIKLGKWDIQTIEHGGEIKKFERVRLGSVWTPVCKSSKEKTKRS